MPGTPEWDKPPLSALSQRRLVFNTSWQEERKLKRWQNQCSYTCLPMPRRSSRQFFDRMTMEDKHAWDHLQSSLSDGLKACVEFLRRAKLLSHNWKSQKKLNPYLLLSPILHILFQKNCFNCHSSAKEQDSRVHDKFVETTSGKMPLQVKLMFRCKLQFFSFHFWKQH